MTLIPKEIDPSILPIDQETGLPDPYIADVKTYPEYLRHSLLFLHARMVAGIVKPINPGNVSYFLKDNGVQAFLLMKFLENMYLDQFLSTLSVEDFYENTEFETKDESLLSYEFDAGCYLKSLEDSKSFILGTLSEDRSIEITNLFKVDFITNLSVDTVSKTSTLIEKIYYSLSNCKKFHSARFSFDLHLDSSLYTKMNVTCSSVLKRKLPYLTYDHSLQCEECFSKFMTFESIDDYKNELNITILFSFFDSLSLIFGGMYSSFANSESKELISHAQQEFSIFLKKLYLETIGNKIPTMNSYFNYLENLEKKQRRQEARNLQRLKDAKNERKLQEDKALLVEEKRIHDLKKERIAKLELQARLEESKALLEEQKVKEEQYQAEQLHRKINYILTRKSEILLELENLIQQLEACEYDSSAKSVRWKRELQKSLTALSDEFNFLSNLDEVRVSESLEISLDFLVEEFDDYLFAVNEDFQTLIESLSVENA